MYMSVAWSKFIFSELIFGVIDCRCWVSLEFAGVIYRYKNPKYSRYVLYPQSGNRAEFPSAPKEPGQARAERICDSIFRLLFGKLNMN